MAESVPVPGGLLALPFARCGVAPVTVDRAAYARAAPWPHVVVDDAFDPALVRAAEVEQMEVARNLRPHVSRREVKAESSRVVGPASQRLIAQLDSPEWVEFLEALTGVAGLEPDPSRFWAGVHVGPPGAFQTVHRDFQKHPATGLHHRVNVLLYLSSGWEAADGGELELWSSNMQHPEGRILPGAGRLVIFESHWGTPHGVSRQTSSDPDKLRLAFVAYYYSRHPPAGGVRRRGTLFQPRVAGEPFSASLIDVADAIRGLRRRAAVVPSRALRLLRCRSGRGRRRPMQGR